MTCDFCFKKSDRSSQGSWGWGQSQGPGAGLGWVSERPGEAGRGCVPFYTCVLMYAFYVRLQIKFSVCRLHIWKHAY